MPKESEFEDSLDGSFGAFAAAEGNTPPWLNKSIPSYPQHHSCWLQLLPLLLMMEFRFRR